jgi:hypothetical protein
VLYSSSTTHGGHLLLNCSILSSVSMSAHLRSLLSKRAAVVSVQSLPPNPSLHAHVAVHRTSVMEHDGSTVPDGSECTHAPFPEHTEPRKY